MEEAVPLLVVMMTVAIPGVLAVGGLWVAWSGREG